MANKTLSSEALKDIIHRIVDIAHPERIIMFGSSARGDMGPDSDVDLLVIKGGSFGYHKLLGDIYMNLHGVEEAVDVVLVTPEQVEKYKDTHCLVIAPALKEGREVYHA
jgi:predicted nucleotidyltransferase